MTNPSKTLFADLTARGLVAQTTAGMDEHLAETCTLYCGFDPTADSLHIGSLVPLLTLKRFQDAGHTPIVLVGGATGMIGDPSFKAQERKLNDITTIQGWVEKLKTQTSRFVNFKATGNPAKVVNNYDWTHGIDVLTFLRDVGKHFTVNNLISKEAIKSRLEREDSGISYTEFTYPLLQAFDFQQLYMNHSCTLQLGGSDQWGNMTAGTELIRKTIPGASAHVMTVPLVTKADGTKFGKTESGTIWLDAAKTSPYAFYQFWLNTADADVEKFLLYFSFRSVDDIKALYAAHAKEPHLRHAQTALAEDVTTLVHGAAATAAAQRISAALFGGDVTSLSADDLAQLAMDGLPALMITNSQATMSTSKITAIYTEQTDFPIIDVLVMSGHLALANSKREARDFIKGKGVMHNGKMVEDETFTLTPANALHGKYHLLRRGKKNYALLVQG